jgi:hypothetical protein
MWLLHQVAQTYSTRPSKVVGIRDDWLAYQFDVAVLLVGQRVERMTADGKVSVAAALASLAAVDGSFDSGLRPSAQDAAPTGLATGTSFAGQKWRDPHGMVSRVMEIPESGIW